MKYFTIGFSLIIVGIVMLLILSLLGLVSVGLFIIFPFFISANPISALPIILIIIGFLFFFIGPFSLSMDNLEGDKRTEMNSVEKKGFGGLIMIGPIPIVFGNNRSIVYTLLGVAIVIIILVFLFHYL
ncbi:MAG: DUF131 domain-containing protein [Thermoplasmataceae archaeon]|jgi:uncharacterized protein (TIGR00304 family)